MEGIIKKQNELLAIDLPYLTKEIVDMQYVLQPEFHRYGARGMVKSLEDAKYNLDFLFAAVEAESPILFENYSQWTNELFDNIGLPRKTLEVFYDCLKEVLEKRFRAGLLDGQFLNLLSGYIESGISVIRNFRAPEQRKESRNPYMSMLEAYSGHLLSGDKDSAVRCFIEIIESGIPLIDIYQYILAPFQHNLGELWHKNKISVAQEHFATAVSQFAMTILYEKVFSAPKDKGVFLGTCVQGELHEFGVRMVCDYLESVGWNTYYLGANMPESAVVSMVRDKAPDVVGISCTMAFNVPKAQNLINTLRKSGVDIPVIVGGYPFNVDRGLWSRVGAAAAAESLEDTVRICEKLRGGVIQND